MSNANSSNTLGVAFANLSSTLVNLPPEWANALWDRLETLQSGQVVLALSWKDAATKAPRKAYLGWAGGATTATSADPTVQQKQFLEIDAQYGRALRLQEGQKVQVEFCRDVVAGRSVHVEPLTIDDWEILEHNAGYLEEQFLNQVRVVWKDQIITVWIHGQTIIRLQVVETDPPAPCLTLAADAEVIVAPKQRRPPPKTTDDPRPSAYPPSKKPPTVPARLLPNDAFSPGDAGITDFPTLPTIYLPHLKADGSTYDGCVAYITQRDFAKKSEDPAPVPEVAPSAPTTGPTGLYVQCRHVAKIPEKHAWANNAVWDLLGLRPFAKLRIHLVSQLPATSFKLLVKPVTVTKGESIVLGKNKEDSAIVVQAMQEFLGRITFHSGHTLLTTETIHEVPLKLSSGTTTNVQITVLPEKGNVAKSAMPLCARIDAVAVETITIEMGASVTVKDTSQEAREPVPRLAGVDALMQQLHFEMKTRIAWPMIRKAMGAPAPGGILLYGSRGSGKTSIVKAAAHALSLDWETLAHSVFVDCADLASERPIRVKDILQDAVYKAIWQFPCILVLDDLDRMIPAEQEHTDSSRSRQLTEIFIELMNRARQSFGLVILATCQQRTSVHAALLTQHLFGEILHITPPGKPQRQQLLEIMLQSTKLTTYSPASLDLSSVAGTTEGYSPADLYTLTQRAVHGAAIRHVDDRLHGRQIARESEMRVEGEDYVKAQEGFVPANLKNVKLEKGGGVAWSDVGGLRQTKRTLLETLEWPTKYAAIFANCALRLRSGLLLYGFPGCGKTLLASAVAKECGLNFISVKGPELLNKYIGASEQSVRDLFERASAAKPCILFFDEFDAIAPRRGNDNTGVTDRVVNQMLTQMDGAEGLDGVYVLAATSRPDIIDPALLRPGRLDKSLLCGMPDEAERLEILQAVSTKLSLEPSVSLASYAARTEGFSGADLQALLYNAHLEAIHHVIDAAEAKKQQGVSTTNRKERGAVEFVILEKGAVKNLTPVERSALATRIEATHKNAAESIAALRGEAATDGPSDVIEHPKTYISSADLDEALRGTRPSVSEQEKMRLQRIYDSFLGGKPAEASVGQRATMA